MLPMSYACRYCCHLCKAVKGGEGALMTDFSELPAWLSQLRSHHDWLAAMPQIPALALIPGFHLGLIVIDPMHIIHLGLVLWAVGNMLVANAERGIWGIHDGDRKSRLDKTLAAAYVKFEK